MNVTSVFHLRLWRPRISKIASCLLGYRRVPPRNTEVPCPSRTFSYRLTILLMHGSRFTFTCGNPEKNIPRTRATALRLFPVTVASSVLASRLR